MKIAIVARENAKNVWAGDLKALQVIRDGLLELKHECSILNNVADVKDEDFVFLTNTSYDLSSKNYFLKTFKKKDYGIVAFHEDYIKYDAAAFGLYKYLENNLLNIKKRGFEFPIERLIENPSLIYYYSILPRKNVLFNYEALKTAKIVIANSKFEKKTILRDCPKANVGVVYWTAGCEEYDKNEKDDSFLKFCGGLNKNKYLLQIGRLQVRKNQLTTVLASKDVDIPLVFIATKQKVNAYQKVLIDTILKYRKAFLTIIVSQDLPEGEYKNLKIISMPKNEKLTSKILYSAFVNCGLYIHPAFYELPGYVYLEVAKLGIPCIASKWSSVYEYFSDPKTDNKKYLLDDRIEYVEPYDINTITKLINKKAGKRYPKNPDLWIYKRTKKQVAKEIINLIP